MNASIEPPVLAAIVHLRAELWDAGYRPLPVLSHDHPNREIAGKAPLGREWPERARRDPPEAVEMPAVPHATNTGILCDQLRAVDIDVDEPELAGRIRALAVEMLGDTILRFRENSGRCLLPYHAASGSPPKRALVGRLGKIEVLGHGQQFVAHGTHPSGAALHWYPDPPEVVTRDTLPAVTEDEITAFLTAIAPLIDADPPATRDRTGNHHASQPRDPGAVAEILDVLAALAAIPNAGSPDWEVWNAVGMATWIASAGSVHGFNGWSAWSAQNPTHDEVACEERWRHYPTSPPDRTGAGKLYKLVAEAIPGWQRPSETRDRARGPESAPPDDTTSTSGLKCVALVPIPKDKIPPRPWAYGRFLLFGSAACLGAVDGGGKGAIAVVTALAMITGRPLLGEHVWRTGPVAIVSYEDDQAEWHRRFAAACEHYGIDPEHALANVHFITRPDGRVTFAAPGPNGPTFPDGDALITTLKKIGAVLLIVDPFNHAHQLDDGNSNAMIAKVAAEMTRVANEGVVAALVLHHLRKGSTGMPDDLMGATSLRATFRTTRILARMTPEVAKGLKLTDAWRYIRIAGSKENYAPPPEKATWVRLASVALGNGTDAYPDGDEIAVATHWEPRPLFEGMDAAVLRAVFEAIRQAPHSPRRQAKNWVGQPLTAIGGRSDKEANSIIKTWLETGVLTVEEYTDEHRHKVDRVMLAEAKATEILAGVETAYAPPE